jgi:hypothetical protein
MSAVREAATRKWLRRLAPPCETGRMSRFSFDFEAKKKLGRPCREVRAPGL